MLFNHFGGELFRLERSGSVADGNQGNAKLSHQFDKMSFRFILLALAADDVQGVGGQHFALGIDDRGLAAGTVPGIQTDNGMACDRLLQQQLPQVDGKYVDGLLFRFFSQLIADFALNGRENQAFIRIGTGFRIHGGKGGALFDLQEAVQFCQHAFFRIIQRQLQVFQLFAPV